MTNPYEPPKTIQEVSPEKQDFFVRVQKYQYRMFYSGTILCILTAIFLAIQSHPILSKVLYVFGAVGVLFLFVSLGSILPLAIWGFVKGYREARKR